MSTDRIVVTHAGSLVRPDDLIPYLRAIDRGEPYDEAAHAQCLADSVRDVVARQRDVGVDVVSDGEYGKSAWNYYVYERLGGIELREHPPGGANFASVNDAPTDWTRFPEFYADYFATQQEYDSPGGDWACVGPSPTRAARRSSATSPTSRPPCRPRASSEGFLPVVAPASCFPNLIDEHYGSEEAALMGIAEALREEYRAIVDAGLVVQIDDAYMPFMYDVLVPPATIDEYRAWAQPRLDALSHALEGIPEERVALPRLLGELERAAHQRRRDEGHRRPGAAGARRQLPLRGRQPAPRARVARLGGRRPARGQDDRPRRDQPRHERRRAPRARRRAARRVSRRSSDRRTSSAGTDCGFAQGPYIQRVHPSIMWAKLTALAEGAALATEREFA